MRRIPRGRKGQQRVSHLLETAADLFARQGYESTSTGDIAEQAGVAVGALYQYFPNKSALLEALARGYLEQSRALFATPPLDLPPDPSGFELAPPQPEFASADEFMRVVLCMGMAQPAFTWLVLSETGPGEAGRVARSLHDELEERILDRLIQPGQQRHIRRATARSLRAALTAILAEALSLKMQGQESEGWSLILEAQLLLRLRLKTEVGRVTLNLPQADGQLDAPTA